MTSLVPVVEIGGIRMSRIGFGCSSLMRLPTRKERQNHLARAFEEGVSHFDVARMYGLGEAEAELGRFAKSRRNEVTIATKFGIEVTPSVARLARLQAPARALLERVPSARRAVRRRRSAFASPRRYGAAQASRSLEKSLRELDTDYVDFLFVHDPTPRDDVRSDELHGFFVAQRQAGTIRAWGVSQEAFDDFRLLEQLGDQAVLQARRDILTRSGRERPSISFGIMGHAYSTISRALEDRSTRIAWSDALGRDLLANDVLPRLLLMEALEANDAGAVLYNTLRRERLVAAAEVARGEPDAELLATLRDLIWRDASVLGSKEP